MLVKKNIIILHPTDEGACAFYRANFITSLLQSQLSGEVKVINSPVEITDDYVLQYTAAIVVYRPHTPEHETLLQHYKRKRNRFKFCLFADYDDLMFDLKGKHTIPDYNPIHVDTIEVGKFMERCLGDIDGITVSTEWIRQCMFERFGWTHVQLLPNAVPRYVFGQRKREPLTNDLKKPVVLYAGSTCHFKQGHLGDFEGPWVPWLKKAVKQDRMELHLFHEVPDFLEDVKEKIVLHEFVSAVEFPSTIAAIRPDFYLAPLQDNAFNRAKSNLKLLEASAIGAVLLGSMFPFSPYGEAHFLSHVFNDDTENSLENLFYHLCKSRVFNTVLAYQHLIMDGNSYWMDSKEYMARWLRTYFGNDLKANF